jgi:Zn-dependent peptidase ImmA (M78 family)
MTEFADRVGPVMGTSASLDTDEARFDLTKELQHL